VTEEAVNDEAVSGEVATEDSVIDEASWRRVSSKYIVVDVVGYIIFAAVVLGIGSFAAFLTQARWLWIVVAALAVIFMLVITFTPRRVRSIGYQLRSDDLLFCRGILFHRVVAVPYGRMQLVDINRGPLDRMLGLSELKFVTAAASTAVVIPGLPAGEAEELRDCLVALAESRRAGL
jgi:membrane protein YdbS with pleckstrin-like domain